MNQHPPPLSSRPRPSTYLPCAGLVLTGLALEHFGHEMHLSKLLIFAALAVWARELPRLRQRVLLLLLVGLLEAMILFSWAAYPQGPVNSPPPGFRIKRPKTYLTNLLSTYPRKNIALLIQNAVV